MNKRGISPVVAVVLIILIVISAVTIIWVAIVPMIRDNLSSDNERVDLTIETSGGYTFWDDIKDEACVQVKRGSDNADLEGIKVVFSIEGNSIKGYFKSDNLPGINEAKKQCFSGLSSRPESIKVVPVFKNREGDATSEVSNSKIPEGTNEGGSILIDDVECKDDSNCSTEESCVNNKCKSKFIPRCGPFLNATWSSSLDILADGAFDREGPIQTSKLWDASDYLDIVSIGDGYSLRARAGMDFTCDGTHCYEKVVIKDFNSPKTVWGGEIYVNLSNLIFNPGFALAFVGGYTSSTSTTRNFVVAAYYDAFGIIAGWGNPGYYIYLKAHHNNNLASPTESQVFLVSKDSWPDKLIKIEWYLTPNENLFARVDGGEWKQIPSGLNTGISFQRVDVGWVSSRYAGSIDIKNFVLYNESCVTQWILEN